MLSPSCISSNARLISSQSHGVSDDRIDLDLSRHRLLHHSGKLAASLHATEGATSPHTSSHQLERTGRDLLAAARDADDRSLAPTLVAALESRAHQLDIAHTLEGVVDATIGHVDQNILDRRIVLARIDAVGGSQLPRQFELRRVDVHSDDATGLRHHRSLDHRQAHPTEAEDRQGRARLDLGRVLNGSDTGGDAATQ